MFKMKLDKLYKQIRNDVWDHSDSTAGRFRYYIIKYCVDRGIEYSFDTNIKYLEIDVEASWLYDDIRDITHFKLDYDLLGNICEAAYHTLESHNITNIYNVTLTKINNLQDIPPKFGLRLGYIV